ncbi:sugar ABC transporter ATP-binding protein, partial [Citrobacter freundii]
PHLPVTTLSGRNAHRISRAKWEATNLRILLIVSPTVGEDIPNKEGIYQIARAYAEQGMAVRMNCYELPEEYYNSHSVMEKRRG